MFSLVFYLFVTNTYCQEIENCKCKSRNFKLIKKEGLQIDTTLVKINGIYIFKDSIIDLKNIKRDRYSFCRFFENGRVFFSCGYFNFPHESDLNNLSYGYYGEYKIIKNQIIIESYSSYVGYILELYKIEGLKIISTDFAKRSNKPKFEKVFSSIEYDFYKFKL
ncbi:hypothetical protein [Flavobacterium sp.]|uniref:hypothetical protein n=1 Tax=Flavobacterium sp. TaxID=239 RepID=UPI0038FC0C2E